MKRISCLLLLCSIIFLAGSCKKDNDSAYFFRIKKDGNWIDYKTVAGEYGPDLGNASLTNLGVRGQNADASEVMDITIQVDGSSVPNGTYHSDEFSSNYQTSMSVVLQTGSSLSWYDVTDAPSMPPSKYSFTITGVTDDAISGRFTGNYLYDDFSTSGTGTLAITEGEFHVKRIR